MDDVTALRDALLDGFTSDLQLNHDDREALAERFDALIAAVEAAAARRAIEGSGVVRTVRGLVVSWSAKAASLRLTRSERHIGQAIGFANAAFDLDQALAALPRPEEPRVERCAVCGVGRWVTAHDPEAGSSHHPFTPEVR